MNFDDIQERQLIHRNMERHLKRHRFWKRVKIEVPVVLIALGIIGLMAWVAGHPGWLR